MAGKKNGTLRRIEGQIRAFRKRTGRDLDAIYIGADTFAMLPEDLRGKHADFSPFRHSGWEIAVMGVPVRRHTLIPPEAVSV